jgi:hypothetical protein
MIQDKKSSTAIVLACSHSKDVNTGNWIGYHNYKQQWLQQQGL